MAPERVFIGLGANLGDARATVEQALRDLAALPQTRVVTRSALYRSKPVDADGPDFINAAAELHTALEPMALLQSLQTIEQQHGRLRPYRNAARTLDLDVLLYGQRVSDDPVLQLPHPRLHLRAFALQPLLEIDPQLQHPRLGSMARLLAHNPDPSLERLESLG